MVALCRATKETAVSGEEIATTFQHMREELASLSGKIGELQAEAEEYRCDG
jgi:prefoldin subunit 5